jgi:16S rRNA processing protein RimM
MDRFVSIGEIVKAVGLKGEVKLYPLLDYWQDLLVSRFSVWADGRPAEIVGCRQAGSCDAIKVAGVSDRNGAESLLGREIGFHREDYLDPEFPRPAGGLPFRFLGRPVETVSGDSVGTVTEVRFTGSNYLLVIDDPSRPGIEVLVPAVEPILRNDEGLEGPLVLDPPEGLFDVQSG